MLCFGSERYVLCAAFANPVNLSNTVGCVMQHSSSVTAEPCVIGFASGLNIGFGEVRAWCVWKVSYSRGKGYYVCGYCTTMWVVCVPQLLHVCGKVSVCELHDVLGCAVVGVAMTFADLSGRWSAVCVCVLNLCPCHCCALASRFEL
jgi:hypothetical protein